MTSPGLLTTTMNQRTGMPSGISYAKAVQQVQYPTKEQAIIVDSVEGFSVQDYTLAVGTIVQPSNIRYVSRISHGRICLYLSTKELVEDLVEKRATVKIGTHNLTVRALVSKAKRIILSNVCPIIPSDAIAKELPKLEIKPLSQITNVRAAINAPGYAHVLSFRRQMYIELEDLKKLPESIQINFDDTVYWVYLSAEKLTCFLCKQEGHSAKHCKNDAIENGAPIRSSQDLVPSSKQTNCTTSDKTYQEMPPPGGAKRPRPSTTSSNCTSIAGSITSPKTEDKKERIMKKKIKASQETSDDESNPALDIMDKLEPAREIIGKNAEKYPLDFVKFSPFMSETRGKFNVKTIAERFTADFSSLIDMLTEVYSYLGDRSLKNRIVRVKKPMQDSTAGTSCEEEASLTDDSTF